MSTLASSSSDRWVIEVFMGEPEQDASGRHGWRKSFAQPCAEPLVACYRRFRASTLKMANYRLRNTRTNQIVML